MTGYLKNGNLIEDRYGRIWYEDGIMYASYNKGVVVDEEVARLRAKYRSILSGGKKVPAMVYAKGILYWTENGKKYANSREGVADILAAAVYVESRVLSIILDAGLLVFPPPVPVKNFSNEEKARLWLRNFLEKERLYK